MLMKTATQKEVIGYLAVFTSQSPMSMLTLVLLIFFSMSHKEKYIA